MPNNSLLLTALIFKFLLQASKPPDSIFQTAFPKSGVSNQAGLGANKAPFGQPPGVLAAVSVPFSPLLYSASRRPRLAWGLSQVAQPELLSSCETPESQAVRSAYRPRKPAPLVDSAGEACQRWISSLAAAWQSDFMLRQWEAPCLSSYSCGQAGPYSLAVVATAAMALVCPCPSRRG